MSDRAVPSLTFEVAEIARCNVRSEWRQRALQKLRTGRFRNGCVQEALQKLRTGRFRYVRGPDLICRTGYPSPSHWNAVTPAVVGVAAGIV